MGIGASRSSSAMPAEPNRSYMALCGLERFFGQLTLVQKSVSKINGLTIDPLSD